MRSVQMYYDVHDTQREYQNGEFYYFSRKHSLSTNAILNKYVVVQTVIMLQLR